MSVQTAQYTVSSGWTQVSSNDISAFIQLISPGRVTVHVSDVFSPPNADSVGVILDSDALREISINTLATTDRVRVRKMNEDDPDVSLAVMTVGV